MSEGVRAACDAPAHDCNAGEFKRIVVDRLQKTLYNKQSPVQLSALHQRGTGTLSLLPSWMSALALVPLVDMCLVDVMELPCRDVFFFLNFFFLNFFAGTLFFLSS